MSFMKSKRSLKLKSFFSLQILFGFFFFLPIGWTLLASAQIPPGVPPGVPPGAPSGVVPPHMAPPGFQMGAACHSDIEKFCPPSTGSMNGLPDPKSMGDLKEKGAKGLQGIHEKRRELFQQKKACLLQHLTELSAECKQLVEGRIQQHAEIHEACAKDVQTLCPGVAPGKGRIIECLKKNASSLSESCKKMHKL